MFLSRGGERERAAAARGEVVGFHAASALLPVVVVHVGWPSWARLVALFLPAPLEQLAQWPWGERDGATHDERRDARVNPAARVALRVGIPGPVWVAARERGTRASALWVTRATGAPL